MADCSRSSRAARSATWSSLGAFILRAYPATIGAHAATQAGLGPRVHRRVPARRSRHARDGDAWWFEVDGRELRLSNLNKTFWPDEGYTKGDLLAYYFNVAATDRAAPRGAPAHDEADARRHRRRVLLREVRALARARLDRPLPGAERRQPQGRHRLHDDLRRSRPSLHREPGVHRVPSAALAVRGRGPSRLPVLRPRPVPALHVRGRADGGPPHQGAAGPAGPHRIPEDLGRHGAADLPAARARRLHLRAGPRVRGGVRPADPRRRPRPRHDGVEDRRPHRARRSSTTT